MEINRPDVVTEVRREFERYEHALMTNDLALLDRLFWEDPHTLRYGPSEALYGIEEIRAFRKGRDVRGINRTLDRVAITTYGTDFATAFAQYTRTENGRSGKQTQTWLRTPEGWRIVAAHVSLDPAP